MPDKAPHKKPEIPQPRPDIVWPDPDNTADISAQAILRTPVPHSEIHREVQ